MIHSLPTHPSDPRGPRRVRGIVQVLRRLGAELRVNSLSKDRVEFTGRNYRGVHGHVALKMDGL